MSLFSNTQYRWRETYFVLLKEANCPAPEALVAMLKDLGSGYEPEPICIDEDGEFEAITVHSPQDFAAMDITYVSGDDVSEQMDELILDLADAPLTDEGRAKMAELHHCDARFEIYHFEQIAEDDGFGDDDDGFLDPGSLITVLRGLAALTHGIVIDPQAGVLI